jgi:predicted permease
MTHDLRFALRLILSHRWFSAAIVATLALGIGLNTMVFTLVDAVLFKPVPVPGGNRLVTIHGQNLTQGEHSLGVSYPDFRDYRAQTGSFEALEAVSSERGVLSEQGNPPQMYSLGRVTSGIFQMVHTSPILGRGFQTGDNKPGADPVLMLGYNVWRDRYDRSPGVLGRVVRVSEKPATIIGVMPEGFKFPRDQDLWMALVPTPEMEKRSSRPLDLFGILKPGVSIERAKADLSGVAGRIAAEYPREDKGVDTIVETFQQRYNGGPIRAVFLLMLAAVGFVLLIACANVANMMLSRAFARRREISIRAAMGASRWRVVRQLLIESLLLSVLGGVLGLGLSYWGVHWFDLGTRDVGKPYWILFTMDYRVFAYFAGVCVLSGLLFGLAPALRSSRADLNDALRDGVRTAGTRRGGKLSAVLVVFQFALTLVLLTCAGVFVRSFLRNLSLNDWVPSDQLLTARVVLPSQRYADTDARQRFFDRLLPNLRAIPGVTRVALTSNLPGMGVGSRHIEIEHSTLRDPARGPSADVLVQSPGYFGAIDLPLLAGRDFNETDGAPGHECAIVTREFAARFWPRGGAIGKRFRFYSKDKPAAWMTVTGVAANMVQEPDEKTPNPLLFVPYRQEGYDSMVLLIRSVANPSSASSAVRAAVQNLDQDLPLFEVRTLTTAVERRRWYLRLFGTLFSGFAFIALVMASVGLYAVIAQATSRRTQEIGIRMALGATSRDILGMILARGIVQLAAGLAIGLAAAIPAARLMKSLPLPLSPMDPAMFVAISLLLTAVGLFACWLPARRAAGLHPLNAIRYE